MNSLQPSGVPFSSEFISPWMEEESEQPGPSKHALFRELALQVLRLRFPWLHQLIERTGAQILAGRGAFYIALPDDPSNWIPVPELAESLNLMPWPENGETAQ